MQAATTTTTTTKTKKLSTNSSGNMVSSVAVTSATKTTTTNTRKAASATAATTGSPKSPRTAATSPTSTSSDANAEIAELSKKINEHADAIYHTWKTHRLEPAQLLEMCTNAATVGDFSDVAAVSAASADSSSTEDLKKLVNSFVIKDKEQRGKNSVKKSPASNAEVIATAQANGKPKKTSLSSATLQKSGSPSLTAGSGNKSSTATVKAATGAKFTTEPLQSPKKVAAASATKVTDLALEQTQNLLKISELLQQKQKEPTTVTSIAKKRQQSSNGVAKQLTENVATANSTVANKLTEQQQQQQSTKPAQKVTTKGNNAIIQNNAQVPSNVDVVDAQPLTDKNKNSEALVMSRSTTKATASVSKLVKSTKESGSTEQKPATKEKPAVARRASNRNSSNSNSTTPTDNTNISNMAASSLATSMDASPATSATSANTTMPTLNKVKPTSGSRAALTNGQDKNLGRPILTRGSVAERVLMFEKCPDVRNSFLNIKRPEVDTPPKSLLKVKLHATPPPPPQEQNSLQKQIRNTKSVYIPRFYFPHGKPQPTIAMERVLRGILSAFDSFPNNQVTKDELPRILKLCGLPFYWRMPVMVFCQTGNTGLVERQRFVEFWKQMNVYCHEAASRFVYILSRGQRFRSYIVSEDLVPMVQDVVDTHPGLAFLKEATEFHSRYVHTVIARIFYSVNRSWSGRITIAELKRSDLLEMISLLEEEEDINQIMAFFSYEHFYVIYCKFWELDKDHDLLINQEDLARHSDHALSTRIVERIFSGCVTRTDNKKAPEDEPKMSYTDFVWFILSEEDKRTATAIEYWFRCMDIDGDGALSMYELEYFYEEQQQRMEGIGIECLPFEDCLCQMLDMIKPANRDCITLGDLKRCKMTHVFFDTFFNLEKYLDHEQRDPFASQRDEYTSDWDRFAAQEYELLITEEND
ncbi:serine/threonine-protein phosphatase 2A regulatory subunit B'' subunit alpha [Scaptodrosophila lebanonensis]|uniref:Serine/threonine-protein phosphatase 2A regulatory subunit B'' subunit alpha n=1 Tax=Drosophila lebanonensis TaxID=7225 RepID=A0A6J2TFN6_DROLE|nr:serine/threonine-protein phosphatase 2A regulatory subunit B'' subunit alpha [Scaptodrosophila lebanonensis]